MLALHCLKCIFASIMASPDDACIGSLIYYDDHLELDTPTSPTSDPDVDLAQGGLQSCFAFYFEQNKGHLYFLQF